MLAIRMQCKGRTHYPVYRIVVQESQRHPLSGRIVADLGSYNPHTKVTVLDQEKVEFYLKNGAQPSTRVARVLTKEGIKLPSWVKPVAEKHAQTKNPDKLRKNQPKEAPVAEGKGEAAEAATEAAETTEASDAAEATATSEVAEAESETAAEA